MKVLEGKIISNKMGKTAVVEVIIRVPHPVYKKIIKKSKKYKVDTNNNNVYPGNVVAIEETRPVSKDKHFKIVKVISRAQKLITTENTEEFAKNTVGNNVDKKEKKPSTSEDTEGSKVPRVPRVSRVSRGSSKKVGKVEGEEE